MRDQNVAKFANFIKHNKEISINYEVLLNLILRIGLSVKEVCEIRLSNINVSDEKINFLLASTKGHYEIIIKNTENTKYLSELFRNYLEYRKREFIKHDYLFSSKKNEKLSKSHITEAFKRIKNMAEAPALTIESIRNSNLNLAKDIKGKDIKIVFHKEPIPERKEKKKKRVSKDELRFLRKEDAIIKDHINNFEAQKKPIVLALTSELGFGKTYYLNEIKEELAFKNLNFYQATFYKNTENFSFFYDLFNQEFSVNSKYVLYERISSLFIERAKKTPFILLIDDFHFCDRTTLEFFVYFLKNIEICENSFQIFICITIDKEKNVELIQELEKIPLIRWLELEKLTLDSLDRFAWEFFDEKKLSKHMIENLSGLSSGNPLYVKEILAYFYEKKSRLLIKEKNELNFRSFDIPKNPLELKLLKYDHLEKDKKKIIDLLACFLKPVQKENFFKITGNNKENVANLIGKNLIKKEDDKYFLEEAFKDHVYESIDDLHRVKFHKKVCDHIDEDLSEELIYQIMKTNDQKKDKILEYADYLKSKHSYYKAIDYYTALLSSRPSDSAKAGERVEESLKQNERDPSTSPTRVGFARDDNSWGVSIHEVLRDIYVVLGDFKQASVYQQKLIDLFRDDSGKVIEARIDLADLHLKNQNINESISGLERLLEQIKDFSDSKEAARIHFNLAKDYTNKGEADKALNFAQKSLNISCTLQDNNLMANSLYEMGLANHLLGKYDDAVTSFSKSIELAGKAQDDYALIKAENSAGVSLYFKGEFKKSMEHYKRALSIAQKNYDKNHVGIVKKNIGTIYHGKREIAEALNYYQGALACFKLVPNKFEEILCLVNVGIIYFNIGRLNDSYLYVKQAQDLSLKNRFTDIIPLASHLLGIIKRLLGEYFEAHHLLSAAVEGYQEKGKIKDTALALFSLAENFIGLNNFREAKEKLEEGLEIANKHNFNDIIYNGYILKAEFYLQEEENDADIVKDCITQLESLRKYNQNPDLFLKDTWISARYHHLIKDKTKEDEFGKKLNSEINKLALEIPDEHKDFFIKTKKEYFYKLSNPELNRIIKGEELLTERDLDIKIFSIFEKINREKETNEVFSDIAKLFIKFLKAEGIIIFSYLEELGALVSLNKNFNEISGNKIKKIEKIVRQSAKEGLPINSDDYEEGVKEIESRYWQIFPIKIEEKILGFLYVEFNEALTKSIFVGHNITKTLMNLMRISLKNWEDHKRILEMEQKEKEYIERITRLKEEYEKAIMFMGKEVKGIFGRKKRRKFKYDYEEIIGEAKCMHELFAALDKIIESNITVLISGGSGTGKELVARAIHYNSKRKDNLFVSQNCAALPPNLLESELFGHVKGAFTGAVQDKVGLFEVSHNGTLFLDEITEMDLALQAKILRALQEGEIRRVGDSKIIKVNSRIISATNKDIKELVNTKKFREDLFFRLNVINVTVPSLRERKKDIPHLVRFFIHKFKTKKKIKISDEVMDIFMQHDWPGNVRELENDIQKFITLSDTGRIDASLILKESKFEKFRARKDMITADLPKKLDEKSIIIEALKMNKYDKSKTARFLNISRTALYKKMKKYGV